jgi:hypothetical protein
LWIKAIKSRYWIELGSKSDFKVDWQDAKNCHNVMVEHVVKVNKLDADDEQNDSTNLFTLTLYRSKRKIMIQGLFRDHWVEREFPSLKKMVDLLESGEEPSKAYEACFNTHIDLCEDDLILSDIDDDIDPNQSTTQDTKKDSQSKHSRRRCKATPKKLSTKIHLRSLLHSPRNSPSKSKSQLREYPELIEFDSLVTKITKIEDILAHLECSSVSDHSSLERNFHDKLIEIQQQFEDTKAAWKHDLKVLKQQTTQEVEEYKEEIQRLTLENKALSSKFSSIKDLQQKANAKIDNLEVITNEIKDSVTITNPGGNDINETQKSQPETVPSSTDSFNILVEDGTVPPSTASLNATHSVPGEDCTTKHYSYMNEPKNTNIHADIIILMDSNRKFINAKKLSPSGSKSLILKCGNLDSAKDILQFPRFEDPKVIVLHVGVNDVESSTVSDICGKFTEAVQIALKAFPQTRLMISAITPRSDNLDEAVNEVNHFLNTELLANLPPTSMVVSHSNITKDYLFDRKHLSRNGGVNRLAGNLKRAIHDILPVGTSSQAPSGSAHDRSYRQQPSELRHRPDKREPTTQNRSGMEHLTMELLSQVKSLSLILSNNQNHHNLKLIAPSAFHPPPLFQPHQAVQGFQPHQAVQGFRQPIHQNFTPQAWHSGHPRLQLPMNTDTSHTRSG